MYKLKIVYFIVLIGNFFSMHSMNDEKHLTKDKKSTEAVQKRSANFEVAKQNISQEAPLLKAAASSADYVELKATDLQEADGKYEAHGEAVQAATVAKLDLPYKIPGAYFSPGIKAVIIFFIMKEQLRIRAALYEFTLYDLAKTWADKMKGEHRLPGENALIIHAGQKEDYKDSPCQALALLKESGVKIHCVGQRHNESGYYADKSKQDSYTWFENMHHKFILFSKNCTDKPLLITGSFNCTGVAEENNWENVVIIEDKDTIESFITQWLELMKHKIELKRSDLECRKKDLKLNSYKKACIPWALIPADVREKYASSKKYYQY